MVQLLAADGTRSSRCDGYSCSGASMFRAVKGEMHETDSGRCCGRERIRQRPGDRPGGGGSGGVGVPGEARPVHAPDGEGDGAGAPARGAGVTGAGVGGAGLAGSVGRPGD